MSRMHKEANIQGVPLKISLYKAGREYNEYEVRKPPTVTWPDMDNRDLATLCQGACNGKDRIEVTNLDATTKSVKVYRS